MNISTIFIQRPVLSTVLGALILLLGFQGMASLSVRQYPEIEETAITITTIYPGASSDLMQGFVTAPVSAAVATTEDIDYVSSQSRPSTSIVTVQMNLGADPDIALTEVMSKVQQVRADLPDDAQDPIIVKGTGQQFAMMYLALQNPNMTREQLTEYIDRVIRTRMSTIEGVAEIEIIGAAEYAMRVWVDPNLLAAPGKTKNQFAANPLDTADAVVVELPAIQDSLPQGMTITWLYDSTEQISASIEEVFITIAEAVGIVVLVILQFLGSFRSVLMPMVTIPLSLIGVCFILYLVGFSINLLSLLAMVLAIGLVVDDAIVVVENIHRHIEEGMSPMQASFRGMREITGAIIAMTLTLVAVFAPLAFTGGLTGSLFRESSSASWIRVSTGSPDVITGCCQAAWVTGRSRWSWWWSWWP